jgi:hypothetical protein
MAGNRKNPVKYAGRTRKINQISLQKKPTTIDETAGLGGG